jgi:hypothetical protein
MTTKGEIKKIPRVAQRRQQIKEASPVNKTIGFGIDKNHREIHG